MARSAAHAGTHLIVVVPDGSDDKSGFPAKTLCKIAILGNRLPR
jgi:hypothetical protein